MTDPVPAGDPEAVLFAENGASWWWLLAGPASALSMMAIQWWGGAGVQWVVPLAFLVLVSGFVALQIKAARIHTSVELTCEALRQGTQTTLVDEILAVYPPPKNNGYLAVRKPRAGGGTNMLAGRALRKAGIDPAELDAPPTADVAESAEVAAARDRAESDAALVEKWQSARALGELTGVPRGRTGIGLKLRGGSTVQAWARNGAELRAALTTLIAERS
jgi:hypothetical protein